MEVNRRCCFATVDHLPQYLICCVFWNAFLLTIPVAFLFQFQQFLKYSTIWNQQKCHDQLHGSFKYINEYIRSTLGHLT